LTLLDKQQPVGSPVVEWLQGTCWEAQDTDKAWVLPSSTGDRRGAHSDTESQLLLEVDDEDIGCASVFEDDEDACIISFEDVIAIMQRDNCQVRLISPREMDVEVQKLALCTSAFA
jgi:hypothetical protein